MRLEKGFARPRRIGSFEDPGVAQVSAPDATIPYILNRARSSGKFEAVLIHLVSEEDLGTIRGHFGPMNYIRYAAVSSTLQKSSKVIENHQK